MNLRCLKLFRAFSISFNSSNFGKFFFWTASKSRKRKGKLLSCVPALEKIVALSRLSRALTAKKCTKSRLIRQILANVFWSWILKDCVKVQEKKRKVVVLCSWPRKIVALSRLSRALTAKKCTKKRDAKILLWSGGWRGVERGAGREREARPVLNLTSSNSRFLEEITDHFKHKQTQRQKLYSSYLLISVLCDEWNAIEK